MSRVRGTRLIAIKKTVASGDEQKMLKEYQNYSFPEFYSSPLPSRGNMRDALSIRGCFSRKRKWIEMDRNEFVLFVSNPGSDLLNPFLSN